MRKFFISLILTGLVLALFAQVSVDPTDKFYREAQGWELKGYIENLPILRPYPAPIIKKILEAVIDCGNKNDAELALSEYERIFSKKYIVYAEGKLDLKHSENLDNNEKSTKKNLTGEFGLAGELILHPFVSFGFDLGMYAESADYEDVAPYYVNKPQDSIYDPSTIGPFELFLDWNTNLTIGNDKIYGTVGLSKIGYGPFINDGLTLNDSAYHSANFMLNYTGKRISYASVYESIGAKTNNPSEYGSLNSGKYLSFHAIKFKATKKIDISYYENIVFGPRFNFAYAFPAPYMAVQNIGGASDNLQMGLLFEVKPISGLNWATDIFVDDFDVNNAVKFNFDSKIRIAGQTGLIFSPTDSFCRRMSLDYQLVMPYTYAHWDYNDDSTGLIYGYTRNYQNYTNAGKHIGAVLDPNSDKVSFSASFQPASFFTFNLKTNYIRHSNTAEAFGTSDAVNYVLAEPGQYVTDGSAQMHQMFSNPNSRPATHVDQAWNHLGFMTSDHKLGIIQLGLDGEFSLKNSMRGKLSLVASYMFEYVKNAGVNKNVYTGLGYTYTALTSYTTTGNEADGYETVATTNYVYNFNGNDYATYEDMWEAAKAVASEQKKDWVSNLHDNVNHYISVGFRYVY